MLNQNFKKSPVTTIFLPNSDKHDKMQRFVKFKKDYMEEDSAPS